VGKKRGERKKGRRKKTPRTTQGQGSRIFTWQRIKKHTALRPCEHKTGKLPAALVRFRPASFRGVGSTVFTVSAGKTTSGTRDEKKTASGGWTLCQPLAGGVRVVAGLSLQATARATFTGRSAIGRLGK
jgi:hypothetical protein